MAIVSDFLYKESKSKKKKKNLRLGENGLGNRIFLQRIQNVKKRKKYIFCFLCWGGKFFFFVFLFFYKESKSTHFLAGVE